MHHRRVFSRGTPSAHSFYFDLPFGKLVLRRIRLQNRDDNDRKKKEELTKGGKFGKGKAMTRGCCRPQSTPSSDTTTWDMFRIGPTVRHREWRARTTSTEIGSTTKQVHVFVVNTPRHSNRRHTHSKGVATGLLRQTFSTIGIQCCYYL